MVEEAKVPHRDIPRAMVLTLLISTILYVAIAAIAVSAVPIDRLCVIVGAAQPCFREVAGVSPVTISIIAIVATLNTILAQMTMSARVDLWHGAAWRLAAHRRQRACSDRDAAFRDRAHRRIR